MKSILETINSYTLAISLNQGGKLETNHILPTLNKIINSDKLMVNVTIDEMDSPAIWVKGEEDISKILEMNEEIDSDSETIVKLEIIKSEDPSLKIYDIEAFVYYLKSLTLQETLNVFKSFSNMTEQVQISISTTDDYYFETNLFNTTPNDSNMVNKAQRLETWSFSSNTQNLGVFSFIPEDFKVINSSDNLSELSKIFNHIALILSIAFISDMSNLNKNEFNFKIIGYKKYDQTIDFKTFDFTKVEVVFRIYQWIYDGTYGNVDDKLGLARNIISRHLKLEDNSIEIDHESYSSIITAHKIYLKENVEKYIETKNKVAEVSHEISVKSKEVSNYISTSFKNNNLTVLSYFITLFIFNSLSNRSITRIFTPDIYYFTLAVLLISTFYLVFTLKQAKSEIQSNIRYFFSTKKIYSDIFDKKELNSIFSKKILKYNIQHIHKTMNRFSFLWLIEIVALFLCTILLTHFV